MKPLKLEFSGLNSYRDRQVVDFEELGKGGLFGIFGPTGSGKSSILDAITLALYGKVDRAESSTRGIINQREKSVEVSFSFELGGTRYTVQRRYERPSPDSDSARSKSARLIKGNGTVLADRAETVTEKVEELIGLTCQEFCRAVVLPPGKCDEFLRLTGGKRAEMLGHIFNLERFGEQLYNAAVQRRDKWQADLDGIERAKGELGDCSDKAISDAEDQVLEKARALERAEKEYSEAKKAFDEAGKLRELYTQLKSARTQKAQLDARKKAIDQDTVVLEYARRAEPLRNLIDTVERLSRDREELDHHLRDAQRDLEKAQDSLNTAAERVKAARKRQETEEPVLTAKRTRLEEALELQRELQALCRQEEGLTQVLEKLGRQVIEENEIIERKTEELEKLAETIQELQSEQNRLLVDPVERERVGEATTKLSLLQKAESDLESHRRELHKKTELTEKARSAALEVYRELPAISASRYSFDDSGRLRIGQPLVPSPDETCDGAELQKVADREMEMVRQLYEEAEEIARKATIRDQAVLLAQELQEGQPCPVCGSEHHPNVASGSPDNYERAKKAQGVIRSCRSALEDWQRKLGACISAWNNSKLNELEAWEKLKEKESSAKSALSDFLDAARLALGDSYSESTARNAVAEARTRIAAKDKEYSTVNVRLSDAQKHERSLRKDVDARRTLLADLENKKASSTAELKMMRGQIDAKKARILELSGGEDPLEAIRAVDAAIREVREELSRAQEAEDRSRREVDRLGKEVSGLTAKLGQIKGEIDQQTRTLAQGLLRAGFNTPDEARNALLTDAEIEALDDRIAKYREEYARVDGEIRRLEQEIGQREFSEAQFKETEAKLADLESQVKSLGAQVAVAQERLDTLKRQRERWEELEKNRVTAERKREVAAQLASLVRGKALVNFLAEEFLRDIAADASSRLGGLTRQRYALEITDDASFLIRDDFNGGQRRAVSTLSGGEMFLTSLALALALSSKVQLRGQYPLGFFFLDEGFGTLDEEKLDAVIGALERLHDKDRIVGVISHVKELKERLPCYLEVVPAMDDGTGSRVVPRRR